MVCSASARLRLSMACPKNRVLGVAARGASSHLKVGPHRFLCVFMGTTRPSSRTSTARSAPSFILSPAHAVEVSCRRLCLGFRACCRHLECAVRCFGGFAMWVVLVAFMELVGLFVGFASEPASDARQRRPPATPASDARQRRLPAGHTKPPLDSKPAGYARSRSLMPPVTTTARQGCVYRETQRKRTFSLCQTTVLPRYLPGLPRDQFSGHWLFSTAEARTSNSSSSSSVLPRYLLLGDFARRRSSSLKRTCVVKCIGRTSVW